MANWKIRLLPAVIVCLAVLKHKAQTVSRPCSTSAPMKRIKEHFGHLWGLFEGSALLSDWWITDEDDLMKLNERGNFQSGLTITQQNYIIELKTKLNNKPNWIDFKNESIYLLNLSSRIPDKYTLPAQCLFNVSRLFLASAQWFWHDWTSTADHLDMCICRQEVLGRKWHDKVCVWRRMSCWRTDSVVLPGASPEDGGLLTHGSAQTQSLWLQEQQTFLRITAQEKNLVWVSSWGLSLSVWVLCFLHRPKAWWWLESLGRSVWVIDVCVPWAGDWCVAATGIGSRTPVTLAALKRRWMNKWIIEWLFFAPEQKTSAAYFQFLMSFVDQAGLRGSLKHNSIQDLSHILLESN